jgi:hypothetical protein
MDSNGNSIGPMSCGDMSTKEESPGSLKNMSIFSFSYPILLWGLGT